MARLRGCRSVFHGSALIAHHPPAFWRIARYPLDANYVFIGNSQIDRMNLKTIDAATMDPVRLYRVRLSDLKRSSR